MEDIKLDDKINKIFAGCVVRKDLVKTVKGNAAVPSYVLEYLLGQYCATNDEDTIKAGIKSVKDILEKHHVDRSKAGYIKSQIQQRGRYKVIDKVSVALDEKHDCYKASFSELGIDGVIIPAEIACKKYPRLLVAGVWCLADLEYQYSENPKDCPWILSSIKPIQLSHFDFEDFKAKREEFTTNEWIDLLIQSIGFNPEMLSRRNKLLQLVRLIPYCERNYNLIELGPKGTGKSHIYQEFSPNGILLSGGEVTAAKLFVSNAKKHDIGLVGYWDNIAFDEFAGKAKKADKALVDIMKGYMANKKFSRGVGTLEALASMTFVGNTKHNVPYMLKHSNLFEELPAQYLDSAFIDRLHFYIPGWEIDILRPEIYTKGYGFIVDYYSAALEELRKHDFSNEFAEYFTLSSNISTRNEDGIRKTFAGLMKIIHPNQKATADEIEELLKFAMEGRKRVNDQLLRIDSTFKEADFYYIKGNNEKVYVRTLEELQYPNLYNKTISEDEQQETIEISDFVQNEKTTNILIKEELKEKHLVFEENQTGVTYDNLFTPYIKGATQITITDAYIRNFYQMLNLMEFIELVEKNKAEEDEVKIELITARDEYNPQVQEDNFNTIIESCFPMGIEFTYSFDTTIHARSIVTDTGWKISLDRGLDIYQSCERKDVFQFTTRVQKYRPCKKFEITYIKN